MPWTTWQSGQNHRIHPYRHGKKYYNLREDLDVLSTLFCFLVYYEFDRPVVNDVENGRPDRYSTKTPTLPKSLATFSHAPSRIWTFVTVERLKKHSEMSFGNASTERVRVIRKIIMESKSWRYVGND